MLDTTSFAILPSKVTQKNENARTISSLVNHKWEQNKLFGSLSKGEFCLYFVNEKTMRFIVNPFGKVDLTTSIAAEGDINCLEGELVEGEEELHLNVARFEVVIKKNPFEVIVRRNGEILFQTVNPAISYNKEKHLSLRVKKQVDGPIYGLGEKSGFLNKNGSKISNWNTDVYAPHNQDTVELYQSIPFVLLHNVDHTTGIFLDNSFRTEFDMQTFTDQLIMKAEGGQLNTYILLGEDIKETVQLYTDLTGKTPLPPKWSLGYHQSRYSYASQEEVESLVEQFKKYDLPLDCVFLDIHYMDGYRVFTFDEEKFPHYREMIEQLSKQQIDIVTIVDPGVKKDVNYPVYREGIEKGYFSKYLEGEVYIGEVWPGPSAFPDFFNSEVQEWWGNLHKFYTDLGIRGIWNDMNEPSVFNESKTMDLDVMHNMDGKLLTHKEGHNLYGLYMSKATFEGLKKWLGNGRPFSLTRAGFAGVQRYSAVWTGDNRSYWEHLEMSLPMIMNLGLSGVAFAGADVGGFSSDTTPELLIRWTQVGAFLPYFRNHSVQDSIYQEPFAFGQKTLDSVKKYIELRYTFMPYLYTLFYETEKTGIPIVRPLVMEYPNDPETFQCSDQFLLGSRVLVAPILRPGKTHRSVYLPKGTWYDFWTNEKYEGGKYHLINADLDTLPIFIKAGTILPLGSAVKNTKEKQEIHLKVYHSNEVEMIGYLYEDDGYTYNYRNEQYSFTTFKVGENNELEHEKTGSYGQVASIQSVTFIR